jgi:hypothetical protein
MMNTPKEGRKEERAPTLYLYYNTIIFMKVRVYFCRELDAETILRRRRDKIGKQALDTIYDLVWESEFKNILNVGRVWLKFKEEEKPFGIALSNRRSHDKILPGDIIQIANDFYIVDQIGARKVKVID